MIDRNDPASASAVQALRAQWPSLPPEYFELLLEFNGCEGDLGLRPGWLQLWPAEDVVENNDGYQVAEYLPGYLAFGSSGGGEMFVFRLKGTEMEQRAVYMVPFIPMEEAVVLRVADSFSMFAAAIGSELEDEA